MPLPLYGSGGLTFRISAACWPTRCLSMPRTTMVVAFGISKSIPSRGEMTTGCEYPTCKLMSRPCREPRYPTPCIRRVLVKPSVTPVTAFCSRERVSPCIALCSGESEARVSTMLPFSSLTSTPRPTGTVSSPLGPLTCISRPEVSISTLSGTSTGALPILDIPSPPNLLLLIYEAEDLATDAGPASFVVGEDAARGREDRHPQPIEDARDIGLLAVDAPAGPAHAPQAPDRTPPVGIVLELYDELLFRAFSPLRVALYVTLLR